MHLKTNLFPKTNPETTGVFASSTDFVSRGKLNKSTMSTQSSHQGILRENPKRENPSVSYNKPVNDCISTTCAWHCGARKGCTPFERDQEEKELSKCKDLNDMVYVYQLCHSTVTCYSSGRVINSGVCEILVITSAVSIFILPTFWVLFQNAPRKTKQFAVV